MYAAVVDGMDQAIAQVLATVEKQGLKENTIVLFMSDNGGAAYASGGANNAPFRGGKGETFEGGIRVVAMMRWPARISPGSVSKDIVSVMDVFPTLAGAAGIEPGNERKLDGKNLWPALAEGKRFKRDKKLFFAAEMTVPGTLMTTVFDDEWKLVQRIVQTQLNTEVTNSLFRMQTTPTKETTSPPLIRNVWPTSPKKSSVGAPSTPLRNAERNRASSRMACAARLGFVSHPDRRSPR